MRARSASIFPVESQSRTKGESVQVLDLGQLRLDALADLEAVDVALRSRARGSRPGARRLLTERRDAMRALALELLPTSVDLSRV